MEVVLIIATIVGGIVGIVQLVKWIKRPKNQIVENSSIEARPYLDVDVTYQGGSSAPMGRSPNARPRPGQDYFVAGETLNIWELEKKILITIVNNSGVAALYPKVFVHCDSFKPRVQHLESIVPIKAHENVKLNCVYKDTEEKIAMKRTSVENFPTHELRNEFQLLVEYQNSDRKKLFTLFKGFNNENEYLESRPDGFD